MSKAPFCWYKRVADEFDRIATQLKEAARSADRKRARELAARAAAIRRDCGCEAQPPQGVTQAAKPRLRLVDPHA